MTPYLSRSFSLPLSIAAFLSLLTGCGDSGSGGGEGGPAKARYAFITNGVAEFWTIAEAGAKQAGQDLGVEVGVFMPGSLTDQKQMMEDAVTRGYAGVAVSPIDPANQTEMLNQVAAATKLVTHDSDAPETTKPSVTVTGTGACVANGMSRVSA
jgi:ribose transport system substrate-binding protein